MRAVAGPTERPVAGVQPGDRIAAGYRPRSTRRQVPRDRDGGPRAHDRHRSRSAVARRDRAGRDPPREARHPAAGLAVGRPARARARELRLGIPDDDRVRTFAAAGVQVIAATDHDVIGDYTQTVAALGLDDRIAVMG